MATTLRVLADATCAVATSDTPQRTASKRKQRARRAGERFACRAARAFIAHEDRQLSCHVRGAIRRGGSPRCVGGHRLEVPIRFPANPYGIPAAILPVPVTAFARHTA